MRAALQLAYGLVLIAALVAIQVAALYALMWGVLLLVRKMPMIGRRHRHKDWTRLNK
jgi:hypothetical protein